ncbi:hypothetical protein BB558_002838 [Smittium angustum]|uniref:Uncharacterized protein n=1 Tax=Smittium angustum TaxID=133377 RepID=A0A2U1J7T9_SMIAN|nr:hypothetical protein BB558_002838 [Smittium angustum]
MEKMFWSKETRPFMKPLWGRPPALQDAGFQTSTIAVIWQLTQLETSLARLKKLLYLYTQAHTPNFWAIKL